MSVTYDYSSHSTVAVCACGARVATAGGTTEEHRAAARRLMAAHAATCPRRARETRAKSAD